MFRDRAVAGLLVSGHPGTLQKWYASAPRRDMCIVFLCGLVGNSHRRGGCRIFSIGPVAGVIRAAENAERDGAHTNSDRRSPTRKILGG